MLAEYAVGKEQCTREPGELIEDLIAKGLVEETGATTGEPRNLQRRKAF